MKIQIISQFGDMTFEMSQEKAMQIITQAMQLANAREQENASDLDISTETPVETAPLSRVERMFGKKETWSAPKGEPARPFVRSNEDGYKGFLYIECESCSKRTGFCVKRPIQKHTCDCGHETKLRDLKCAHVRCTKCGSEFRYHTNIQRDEFTIDCLRCGSPVDMEIGAKGTAFISVWQKMSREV